MQQRLGNYLDSKFLGAGNEESDSILGDGTEDNLYFMITASWAKYTISVFCGCHKPGTEQLLVNGMGPPARMAVVT